MLFTSCVSKQEFPSSWKKIENKSSLECANISGKYLNKGASKLDNYTPVLSDFILDDIENFDTLDFNMGKNSLVIDFYLDKKNIRTKTLNINNTLISCENGFWLIEKDENYNKEGVLGKEWEKFYLSKNKDGLIIRKENNAVGLFFLIPIVGHSSTWRLFRNIK
jgi:hypothetical protein